MNIIDTITIQNSRKYFILRIFAWIGVKSKMFTKLFSTLLRSRKDFPFDDVEAVYAHLNVEREAENIAFIKAICSDSKISDMYDIGSNYMQFSSALGSAFNKIHCYDPNSYVLESGYKEYGLSNMITYNAAVIPNNEQKKDCYFINVKGNSGLSSVVFENPSTESKNYKSNKIDCLHMKEVLPEETFETDLLKIDVEGLEDKLVRDAINDSNFQGIICFESLSKSSRESFSKVFLNSNYIFYVVKYNFSDFSGLMANSFYGILKAVLLNKSEMVIYKSKEVNKFDFDFIPLVFCVPSHLESYVDAKIPSIDGNL